MSLPPAEPCPGSSPASLLRDLGILGWESREAVLIAALALEAPLLLIGPHGVAKSLLLERLAGALACEFRHYNASTLNFDDLVGFPSPDGERVRYLRTPVDAWDAEAVFLDEINRCRPDMQNRLFPLIHERKLQGHALPKLRHRWAAMNPAGAGEDEGWIGAERLDVALADRFMFVIETPEAPRGEERIALIRGPLPREGCEVRLREAVLATKAAIRATEAIYGEAIARYVDALVDALAVADIPLSGRRLRLLYDAIVGVVATGLAGELRDAALEAVRWALPSRATGRVEDVKVVVAHKAAWRFLTGPADPIRRALLAERDPLARVLIALKADDELLAATLLDAHAGAPPVERMMMSVRLFPWLVVNRPGLPGVAFEALAQDVATVSEVFERVEEVATHDPRYAFAGEIARASVGLRGEEGWITQTLWAGFAAKVKVQVPESIAFARRLIAAIPTAPAPDDVAA